MKEYDEFLFFYKKYQKNSWKMLIFSAITLLFASIWVTLDIVRIQPLIIYLLGMVASLSYIKLNQIESNNYQYLKTYLKKNESEILKNKELVFFIDYQLKNNHEEMSKQLRDYLKNKKNLKSVDQLENTILVIKARYEFLSADNQSAVSQKKSWLFDRGLIGGFKK